MSSGLKLLFDENFGRPAVERIRQFFANETNPPHLRSVVEWQGSGTPDEVWIPMLANEEWIVVTADRARRSGGAKLPQLCRAYGVTHILLSASVHHLPQAEKARFIVALWPEIGAAALAPKGTAFVLRLNSAGRAVLEAKGQAS